MNRNPKFKTYFLTIGIFSAMIILISCAAKKPFWGDPSSGLILEYRFPSDQGAKYLYDVNMTQGIDMMGQEMRTVSKMKLGFTATSKEVKKDRQVLGITIDDMNISIESPQGNFNPDLKSILGKSFDMNLSFLGKESDFEGAKKIKYSLGMQGERDLYSQFQNIFPDMAGKPVKVGDTWTTRDTVRVDEGGVQLTMFFNNSNTFSGFETIDGMECAKVAVKIKGMLNGSGSQGGADFEMEGDIEADETWYFAYKKGLLVKHLSDSFTEGTVNLTSPQEMSLPMTMEMKVENKLVK